jgi:hypothetical protein
MNIDDELLKLETSINEFRARLKSQGKSMGFIHRSNGSITLTVYDKEPGGTFYMGPPVQDQATKS